MTRLLLRDARVVAASATTPRTRKEREHKHGWKFYGTLSDQTRSNKMKNIMNSMAEIKV